MNFTRRTLLAAIALPPPIHGQSLVNASILKRLTIEAKPISINLSPGSLNRNWSYHATRVRRVFDAMVQLIFGAVLEIGKRKTFYTVVEAGPGMAYTLLLVLLARLGVYHIVLHHHASNYILSRSVVFGWLASIAGQKTLHVVGSSLMARDLRERYPYIQNVLVSNNSCHIVPGAPSLIPRDPEGPITLGFLSNLTLEKGLGRAIAVALALSEQNVPVRLLLAGPLVGEAAEEAVAAARRRLGERLHLLGSVTGESKANFFNSIDIFLFPTAYKHETHGLVLFEAMSYGIPVVVNETGYTGEFVEGCGAVIRGTENYVEQAAIEIASWIADKQKLRDIARACQANFQSLRVQSELELTRLIEQLKNNGCDE